MKVRFFIITIFNFIVTNIYWIQMFLLMLICSWTMSTLKLIFFWPQTRHTIIAVDKTVFIEVIKTNVVVFEPAILELQLKEQVASRKNNTKNNDSSYDNNLLLYVGMLKGHFKCIDIWNYWCIIGLENTIEMAFNNSEKFNYLGCWCMFYKKKKI